MTTFTIAEAAERTGLTPDALRYYERAGLLLAPVGRETSRRRRYTEADVGWLVLLTKLRATGMPVAGLRAFAALVRAGPGTEPERLALLEAHRAAVVARLRAMEDALAAIDGKLAAYRGTVAHGVGDAGTLASEAPVAPPADVGRDGAHARAWLACDP